MAGSSIGSDGSWLFSCTYVCITIGFDVETHSLQTRWDRVQGRAENRRNSANWKKAKTPLRILKMLCKIIFHAEYSEFLKQRTQDVCSLLRIIPLVHFQLIWNMKLRIWKEKDKLVQIENNPYYLLKLHHLHLLPILLVRDTPNYWLSATCTFFCKCCEINWYLMSFVLLRYQRR